MMRRRMLWVAGLILLVSQASTAQTILWIPYATGKMRLNWTQGEGHLNTPATELRIKCGTTPGQYTLPVKTVDLTNGIPGNAVSSVKNLDIPFKDVFPGPGDYFCINTAAYVDTLRSINVESEVSQESPFGVGGAVAAPAKILAAQ